MPLRNKPFKNIVEKGQIIAEVGIFPFLSQCFFYPVKDEFRLIFNLLYVNAFQFRQGLTLYHTILTFNDLKEGGFGKQCGKRRKCW